MDLSQNQDENSERTKTDKSLSKDGRFIAGLVIQLIEKVENRRFLYDTEDLMYKDKFIVRAAWNEIAADLGPGVTADWCKKRWKSLKDYYSKTKRSLKGKSGQEREDVAEWRYYSAMAFLENCANENEETISNLENTDAMTSAESPQSGTEEATHSRTTTPLGEANRDVTKVLKPIKKRRLETSLDVVNEKIIKLLETPDQAPRKNLNDRFGQRLAERLNNMHPATASYLCMKIENLCYEVEFPQYATSESYTYEHN